MVILCPFCRSAGLVYFARLIARNLPFSSRQNTCSRIDHPSPSSSQVQITAIVCAAGGGPYPPRLVSKAGSDFAI